MRSLARSVVAATSAAAVAALCLVGATPSQAAPKSITIWADAPHAAVLSQLLAKGYKGVKVNVVTKDLAAIRDQFAKEPVETAPDIIWGDQSWSGDLAVAKSILPVPVVSWYSTTLSMRHVSIRPRPSGARRDGCGFRSRGIPC